ncbi:hypothetical protein SAMN04488074_10954 [Lentzea albidocapillata subsp. violacea]|uniref:Uncharacterized protein n=1 Tax=Lentzea albidocapillata subsp. violacea TaxID=128104 RepID=A0A1G9HFQ6_9PSEU|nr:hypothetical protein [Lentzea albidocapillata]SDL11858.1 hypothetical protein SAMN04488074_10954 [Lentzea albidocapillata subsp. violacea]
MATNVSGCLVKVLLFLLGAVMGTGLTAVAGVVMFVPDSTTMTSVEPTSTAPGMYVKKIERVVGGTHYEIWLGPSADRGYVVTVPGGWGHEPKREPAEDGVRLKFANGGEIFVPKASYS